MLRITLSGVLACLLLSSSSHADTIVISDGTFSTTSWEADPLDGALGTYTQAVSDGNPGDYREMVDTVIELTVVFHKYLDVSYNPSIQGAINTLDYSEDSRASAATGAATGATPALMQGNDIFLFGGGFFKVSNFWSTRSQSSITESFFVDWDTGLDSPDFSETGGEIEFGYIRSVSTRFGDTVVTHGIDNWSITLNTASESVPTPSSLAALIGMGLMGVVAVVRRRRKQA